MIGSDGYCEFNPNGSICKPKESKCADVENRMYKK